MICEFLRQGTRTANKNDDIFDRFAYEMKLIAEAVPLIFITSVYIRKPSST